MWIVSVRKGNAIAIYIIMENKSFVIEGGESVEVDLATKKAVLESQIKIDT